jgi:hypothetical protein
LALILSLERGYQMSKFFRSTTTLTTIIESVDTDGVGTTYRGYIRFPFGHEYYSPSECDVCNGEEAVARLVDTGEGVCEDCRQEFKQAGDRLAKI